MHVAKAISSIFYTTYNFLLHLCLYVTYLFMIRFPLYLFVSLCPYVSAQIPDPFVRPSAFQLAYISLICHVCLLSSYINFDLTLLSLSVCAQLESSASQYFCLWKLLDSVICLHAPPETSLPHPSTSQLPCNLLDTHIPAYLRNTWTATEGWHSTRAEATVHTPRHIQKPTRPSLHAGQLRLDS